jgi:hypothetical protein
LINSKEGLGKGNLMESKKNVSFVKMDKVEINHYSTLEFNKFHRGAIYEFGNAGTTEEN